MFVDQTYKTLFIKPDSGHRLAQHLQLLNEIDKAFITKPFPSL